MDDGEVGYFFLSHTEPWHGILLAGSFLTSLSWPPWLWVMRQDRLSTAGSPRRNSPSEWRPNSGQHGLFVLFNWRWNGLWAQLKLQKKFVSNQALVFILGICVNFGALNGIKVLSCLCLSSSPGSKPPLPENLQELFPVSSYCCVASLDGSMTALFKLRLRRPASRLKIFVSYTTV